MENIRAIIFDWTGTLWDYDSMEEFPESEKILRHYKKAGLKLALASLADSETEKQRTDRINNSKLKKYFDIIKITSFDKNKILRQIVEELGLPPEQVLIVDDRTVRGVRYGTENGHPTVWLQKGKFSEETPSPDFGLPSFTIHSLEELKKII
jgi:FMN phosphatase YigB (HAD superfamily)